MRNQNSRPKPAKKIPRGKKPKWYFRLRGANKKAILGLVNRLGKTWKFAGNGNAAGARTIKLARLSEVYFLPLDIKMDRSKFDIFGALDVFIIFKWLQNGTIRLDGEFESIWRICAFDAPIIKAEDLNEISCYHYLCLERDRERSHLWQLHVRARTFVLQNSLDHPYHLAGLPKI